jgi:amidohydrolase
MKAQAQSSGISGFTVRLLGTPAEESGGGKVKLIEAGAYKDVDACLMVHPVPMSPNRPDVHGVATVVEGGYLANDKVKVTYTGKPSHAAAAPWEGINALDAVVSAYVNISLLRQQILPSQKIHGVIVNGGARPNIIPMSASVDYYIRSPTKKTLKALTEKVVQCFEAAATATGCKVEYEWYELHPSSATIIRLIEILRGVGYDDLKANMPICESYVSAMRAMGNHTLLDNSEQKGALAGGSTDMGSSTPFPRVSDLPRLTAH